MTPASPWIWGLGVIVLGGPWFLSPVFGPSPAIPTLVAAWFALGLYVLNGPHGWTHDPARIASAWLIASTLSALFGLSQYFGLSGALAWVSDTNMGEAFANLRQRNQFATLTAIGFLALLWQLAQHKSNLARNALTARWGFLLAVSGTVLLALGNAASASRTGLFQWLLVLGLALMWSQPSERRVLATAAFALSVYVFAAITLPWVLEAVAGVKHNGLLGRFQEAAGCSSRRVLWSNVLYLIAQEPWTGWGWGELDYAHFLALYPGERFCDILDNAHNLPLHIAVELGVPVAVVFCALCGWLVWRNKPWSENDPTRQMAWGVLAVMGLHSLLEYPLWYGPFQLTAVLCIWMLLQSSNRHPDLGPNQNVVQAKCVVVAIVLIAPCVLAAWDYWRISQLYKPPTARTPAYRDNTLEKVRNTWFFQDQVQFAELTMVSLKPSNALQHYAQAQRLLHFSPEPRVIEAAIESAVMLGKDEEALYYLQRYKAAFPGAHAAWAAKSARFVAP